MSVCATCYQHGLPVDGRHDCPGLGDIQVTRERGHGLRVDTAPPRARMALNVLADSGWGVTMQGDCINIAEQALYQAVAYDPITAALVLELVEDWRTGSATTDGTCTATIRTPDNRVIRCTRPAGHYDGPGDWHQSVPDRDPTWSDWADGATPHRTESEPADATVCTPIPAATLTQLSEVPPELLTEEQLGRAENALERLRLAREALIRDGYFTADEVGPDIAPRIVEWLSHHRGLVEELNAELARLRAGEESGWDPMVVPTPGQWIARWNSLGPAQRLDRAKAVIETAETANRCHSEGHALKLEEGRKNWLKLNGGREEVARWKLNTLEPQTARALDDIGRALREGSDAKSLPGFAPFVPEHFTRRETSDDPLAVEPYRNDQGKPAWAFRCWGTTTCAGWLSLDHASENSAEAARDRHLVEAHPELVATALRERRERAGLLGGALGEVLAAFRSVTDDGTRTLVGYVSAPIHPDDMDRWRAVLDQPVPAATQATVRDCLFGRDGGRSCRAADRCATCDPKGQPSG